MNEKWCNFVAGLGVGTAATLAVLAGAKARERQSASRQALVRRVDELTERAVRRLRVPAASNFVPANGVRLHAVVAGPEDGPLAVLLHGFPECWYSWHHQIPLLARAGYRVVAPDQRGYNLSDKPDGVSAYGIDRVTSDVAALIRTLGRERAVIVGHDWGGAGAWRFAMDYPEMVEKLVVMNAPHPAIFARELRQGWEQRLNSWYILFFQLPWLPETLLTFAPRATAWRFFRGTAVREEAFTDADLRVLAAAIAQPGAMTAALNWYRAALRYPSAHPPRIIERPTLVVWGEEDQALSKALTYGLADWVPDLRLHYVLNCGHWVQNEAPDEVNAQLARFLA